MSEPSKFKQWTGVTWIIEALTQPPEFPASVLQPGLVLSFAESDCGKRQKQVVVPGFVSPIPCVHSEAADQVELEIASEDGGLQCSIQRFINSVNNGPGKPDQILLCRFKPNGTAPKEPKVGTWVAVDGSGVGRDG